MASAESILDRFGGVAQVARELNCPLTTVQGWKEANYVPLWRRASLLALALDKKIPLAVDDFPTVSERRSRPKAVA